MTNGTLGPDIHKHKTEEWAKVVCVIGTIVSKDVSLQKKWLDPKLASLLAEADNEVDWNPLTAPITPMGWPWHFNWPLHGNSDSRQRLFRQLWGLSLNWGQKGEREDFCCQRAVKALGKGLHALQDLYAHRYLGPHGHLDKRNAEYVDNPADTSVGYPNEITHHAPFALSPKNYRLIQFLPYIISAVGVL